VIEMKLPAAMCIVQCRCLQGGRYNRETSRWLQGHTIAEVLQMTVGAGCRCVQMRIPQAADRLRTLVEWWGLGLKSSSSTGPHLSGGEGSSGSSLPRSCQTGHRLKIALPDRRAHHGLSFLRRPQADGRDAAPGGQGQFDRVDRAATSCKSAALTG